MRNFWHSSKIFSITDQLLIETVSLLESICEVKLPDGKLLTKLFKIDKLILVLIRSFTKLIPVEKYIYSPEEFGFIVDWLKVSYVVQLNLFNCKALNNEGTLSNLLEIMYKILKPFQYIANLYPIRDLQHQVIGESVNLLYYYHYYNLNDLPKIDNILATIMFLFEKGT